MFLKVSALIRVFGRRVWSPYIGLFDRTLLYHSSALSCASGGVSEVSFLILIAVGCSLIELETAQYLSNIVESTENKIYAQVCQERLVGINYLIVTSDNFQINL